MDRPTVTRSIELDAPADRIWAALGDPDGLAGWLGAPTSPATPGDGPLVAGAALDLDVDGVTRRLVVTTVDEGRALGFVWWDLDRPDLVSTVDVTVDPTDAGGRVTVTETLDPAAAGEAVGLGGAGRSSLLAAFDPTAVGPAADIGSAWDRRLAALVDDALDRSLVAI
jgi:uncharacterized protein YndB with AHSA1/START domain